MMSDTTLRYLGECLDLCYDSSRILGGRRIYVRTLLKQLGAIDAWLIVYEGLSVFDKLVINADGHVDDLCDIRRFLCEAYYRRTGFAYSKEG